MSWPKVWTEEELKADVRLAREEFRHQRLGERDVYTAFYEKYAAEFRRVLPLLPELAANRLDPALLINEFATPGCGEILRYLAAPPVSTDDMATLADVQLSRASLSTKQGAPGAVNGVLSALLDRKRFPWVGEGREPIAAETDAAVQSSASLLASQRVQTDRRNKAKEEQEGAVKLLLLKLGFSEARARPIQLITDAPPPLSFSGSSLLGRKQGDLYARLADKRLLAIECKVSNSEVNSFKRVLNDSVSKAHEWRRALGENQVIPVLVLRGVFKWDNLATAQRDMFLIWDHRLTDLEDFIAAQKG